LNRALFAAILLIFVSVFPGNAVHAETSAPSLKQALDLYRSGSPEQAVPLLKAALEQHPGDPDAWQAHLALARIFYRQGKPADMLARLGAIDKAHRNAETRLLEGMGLISTGQPAAGIELLRPLNEEELNGNQKHLRLAALTEGSLKLDRNAEALFYIQRRLRLGNDPALTPELLQQAHEILKDRLSDEELAEAAFLFGDSPLGQDVRLQQAVRHHEAGRSEQARALLTTVLNTPVDFPFRSDAELLLRRLSRGGDSIALGVVLPLSGRFARFGEQVLRGMELALEHHNKQHPPVLFLVRDSAGDPDLAGQYVAELSGSPQVLGILGPLTGNAADRAAHRAQQSGIPLLSLSQRAGLPLVGPWVFRHSLTAELQAKTLVDYAMDGQKMRTFGILAPDTRLGRESAGAFADAVRARGGKIVSSRSYKPDATDFRRQIKLLQGKDPEAPEPDGHNAKPAIPAPPPPFDALFIPDTPDRLTLIAPQLPFYGLKGTALLGSVSWDTPDLLTLAGPYLEKAVFVSGFYRYSTYPFVKEFVDRYFERYGTEPSLFEAQGYDVAGILLSLLAQNPSSDRDSLRRDLGRMPYYPGVTGATRFTSGGEADKVLYLLRVENGSLVQLN